MNSESIITRQNERELLTIQYAAKVHFNKAEKLLLPFYGLILISSFLPFVTTLLNFYWPIDTIISFCIELVYLFYKNDITKGSSLRNYFDDIVLETNILNLDQNEVSQIKEWAYKVYSKDPIGAEIQMRNSGKDNPPGVYNWYEFDEKKNELDAVFECQKQNIWFNNKSRYTAIKFNFILFFIILNCVIYFITEYNIFDFAIKIIVLIMILFSHLKANKDYYDISKEIDGISKGLAKSLTEENILLLQKEIDKKRAIPVVSINAIYNKQAKKLSELYHKIN